MPCVAWLRSLASLVLVVLFAREATAGTSFVYALREVGGGNNEIYGFSLDATGALTALPGFPIPTGGTGTGLSAAEQMVLGGGRLFALNDGSNTLSVFDVDPATGALTALPYSPFALGLATYVAVAVHPSGSPVVVGNSPGVLRTFNVTPATITEAAGSPFLSANPFSIAFSRDGNYVYAGGNSGNAFAGFSVTPATGVLTALPGSPFPSGSLTPASYATDAAGRLFTASLQSVSDVRVFTTASGVPTAVSGNPFPAAGLNQPVRGVLHPDGYYIVAARNPPSRVGVFDISGSGAATTLTAVPGSPFSSGGSNTNTLALAPGGALLVAGNGGSRNLTVFQVNTTTGFLTSLVVQPANTLGTTGLVTGLALMPGPVQGDFNLDLAGDLLWRNKVSGQNIGWLMNGITVSTAAFLPTIAGTNWEVKGVGDFDASAMSDVIWRNRATGQNIAWLMNGLTVAFSSFLPTIADTNWEIKGVGDFDGDGKADVILRNEATGQNIGWLMNGAGVSLSAFLPPITNTWAIVGVGDISGDGRADVVWRHKTTGQNLAWLMNGLTVSMANTLPTIIDTNWEIKGAGDFDGNGKADIVLRNKVSGQNIGWLMNGTTVATSAFLSTIADTNWDVEAVRDVSGDAKADVMWRNRSTGQNIAWLMNGLAITTAAFLPTIADTNWEIVGP